MSSLIVFLHSYILRSICLNQLERNISLFWCISITLSSNYLYLGIKRFIFLFECFCWENRSNVILVSLLLCIMCYFSFKVFVLFLCFIVLGYSLEHDAPSVWMYTVLSIFNLISTVLLLNHFLRHFLFYFIESRLFFHAIYADYSFPCLCSSYFHPLSLPSRSITFCLSLEKNGF